MDPSTTGEDRRRLSFDKYIFWDEKLIFTVVATQQLSFCEQKLKKLKSENTSEKRSIEE